MKRVDFHASATGQVVRMAQGYLAFPVPSPHRVDCNLEPMRALWRADATPSGLSGLGRVLPNPYRSIAPCLRREAVRSSRIEDTQTSPADLGRRSRTNPAGVAG